MSTNKGGERRAAAALDAAADVAEDVATKSARLGAAGVVVSELREEAVGLNEAADELATEAARVKRAVRAARARRAAAAREGES